MTAIPVGVVVPAKVKNIVHKNSAIAASRNLISPNLADGVCKSPGMADSPRYQVASTFTLCQ